MKKIYAFLLLAAIAGFTLASCSKTEPDTPDTPTTQPSEPKEPNSGKIKIPVKMYVELSPATKVEISGNGDNTYNYSFSATDQLVVSTGGASGVHGTLSYVSGQSLYNFSGVLEADSAPEASETITVKLENTTYKNTGTELASPAISSTLADAVRRYSYFTASFAYGTASNSKIHLTQSTSYLEFTLNTMFTPDGTYEFSITDDSHDTPSTDDLLHGNVTVSSHQAKFVVAMEGDARLYHPKFWIGGKNFTFGAQTDAGQVIAKNKRYTVTRAVEMNERYIPLTIEAKTAGAKVNITVVTDGGENNRTEYSTDGTTWQTYTAVGTNQVELTNVGDKILFRGTKSSYNDAKIQCTEDCYVYGNVMSLINKEGFATASAITSSQAFQAIFKDNSNIYNHPTFEIVLPATTLTSQCYKQMFAGCKNITRAPSLPAATLQNDCYLSMFNGCTSLIKAPVLEATTLVSGCYSHLFYKCSSLTSVTCLATNGFEETDCLKNWMSDVNSSGTFYAAAGASWGTGGSGIPSYWTRTDI